MNKRVLLVSLLGFGLACASTSPGDSSVDVDLPAPATASVATPLVKSPTPLGRFHSAACGSRNYARELEFRPDGTFSAKDLMSPCPLGANCVWSGIMERSGTFAVRDATITLTVTKGGELGGAQPLPQTLTFERGNLVEAIANSTCAYAPPAAP